MSNEFHLIEFSIVSVIFMIMFYFQFRQLNGAHKNFQKVIYAGFIASVLGIPLLLTGFIYSLPILIAFPLVILVLVSTTLGFVAVIVGFIWLGIVRHKEPRE